MEKEIKKFRFDEHTNLGIKTCYRLIFEELGKSFELGALFFRRDFLVRYRQSFLGLTWALIMPVLTTGVFLMLFKSGVINAGGIKVPYIIYAFYGITLWQLFHATIVAMSATTTAGKSLMTTVSVPRFALFYPPLLTVLTDFAIRLTFLAILLLLMRVPFSPALFLPAAISALPLIVLGAGVGLFLTIINSAVRDIANLLHTGLQFLMFLSPVVYPVIDRAGWLGTIGRLNPFTYLLETSRSILFQGEFPFPIQYGLFTVLSAVILLCGLRFYYLSISRVLEVA